MEEILSRIPYELFSYIGGGIFLFIILYRFFPNLFLKIPRPKYVVVEYYDEKLNKSVDRFEDLWAQCIQHEIEHLDGKLFIDHVSKLKLNMARKKQEKANDTSRR